MRLGLGNTFLGSASANQFADNAQKISFSAPEQGLVTTASMSMTAARVPLDVATLAMWMDPATSSNTTTNGASVSPYTSIATANTPASAFTNTGTNRPTYHSTGHNGQPAIKCVAASSQKLTFGSTIFDVIPVFGTVFMAVITVDSISTNDASTIYNNVAVLADSDFGYNGIYLRSGFGTPKAIMYWWDAIVSGGARAEVTLPALPMTNPVLITGWWDGTNVKIQLNNNAIVTGDVAGSRTSIQAPAQIGHGHAYFDGEVSTIFTGTAYDANDVADLKEYCRVKYGLW